MRRMTLRVRPETIRKPDLWRGSVTRRGRFSIGIGAVKETFSNDPAPKANAADSTLVDLLTTASVELGAPAAIAGVIGVAQGEIPQEEMAWATEMLRLLAWAPSSPASGVNGSAQSNHGSDSPAGAVKGRPAKLDKLLAPALAEVGYRKFATLTYRGEWSTSDVEHILHFDTEGVPQVFFRGEAGLRNLLADAFADRCQARYANQAIQRCMRENPFRPPPWFCPLHFSTGPLFGWRASGVVHMTSYAPNEFARTIADLARSKLVPLVRGIVTKAAFLDFLERDEAPLRWGQIGPVYRAAVVAYLAASLGVDRSQTRQALLQRTLGMKEFLDAPRVTPESYIDHILDDAATAAAQAAS